MYINELTKVFIIELERLNRSLIGKTGTIFRANDYGEKIVPNYSQETPKTRKLKKRVFLLKLITLHLIWSQ